MTELPPDEESEMLAWLQSQSPEEQERLLSHSTVIIPARRFIEGVWSDQDLLSVWSLVDPLLRKCLAQRWLCDNEGDVQRGGWDRDEVVAAFVTDTPDHELWHHFERVHLRGFAQWDDLSEWGTGTNTRLHSPDVETVVLLPPGVTVWDANEVQHFYTFLMRHDDSAGWRILNFNSDAIPEPGWPPQLEPAAS